MKYYRIWKVEEIMKILLDSPPLVIPVELANIIGLDESIVLQQIHYYTRINQKADKNHRDGHYWTYNSYPAWQKKFPFWSIRKIKRIFASLKKKKLIITGNYNKYKFDRTLWYRINYEKLDYLTANPQLSTSCQSDTIMHSDKMAPPIPKSTKDSNLIEIDAWDHYEEYQEHIQEITEENLNDETKRKLNQYK